MLLQDEVPAALMDAHFKNVEASSTDGKFDPSAGLAQVCICLLNLFVTYYCGLDIQQFVPGRSGFLSLPVCVNCCTICSHIVTHIQGSRSTL